MFDPFSIAVATAVLTSVFAAIQFGRNVGLTRRVRNADERILKLSGDTMQLLSANDQMSASGPDDATWVRLVRDGKVGMNNEGIRKVLTEIPALVKQETVDIWFDNNRDFRNKHVGEYLKSHKITHLWVQTGQLKVTIGDKKEKITDVIISDKCARCDMIHRYFAAAGSPEEREYEGFFMGGNRLDTTTFPPCLDMKLHDQETAKGSAT